jgi:hypothetical protein
MLTNKTKKCFASPQVLNNEIAKGWTNWNEITRLLLVTGQGDLKSARWSVCQCLEILEWSPLAVGLRGPSQDQSGKVHAQKSLEWPSAKCDHNMSH